MNDVVTGASTDRRVLVTGFGPFPGAPTNPTLDILRALRAEGVAGAALSLARLPVTFGGVAVALREAAAACRPDAVLLLGLARRRHVLNIETVACNRAAPGIADGDGAPPPDGALVSGAPATRKATWPAQAVLDALRASGHEAVLSIDAGGYVCNAALFHALDDALAPTVGFLHVPPLRTGGGHGTTVEAAAHAVRIVVGVLVAHAAGRVMPR